MFLGLPGPRNAALAAAQLPASSSSLTTKRLRRHDLPTPLSPMTAHLQGGMPNNPGWLACPCSGAQGLGNHHPCCTTPSPTHLSNRSYWKLSAILVVQVNSRLAKGTGGLSEGSRHSTTCSYLSRVAHAKGGTGRIGSADQKTGQVQPNFQALHWACTGVHMPHWHSNIGCHHLSHASLWTLSPAGSLSRCW